MQCGTLQIESFFWYITPILLSPHLVPLTCTRLPRHPHLIPSSIQIVFNATFVFSLGLSLFTRSEVVLLTLVCWGWKLECGWVLNNTLTAAWVFEWQGNAKETDHVSHKLYFTNRHVTIIHTFGCHLSSALQLMYQHFLTLPNLSPYLRGHSQIWFSNYSDTTWNPVVNYVIVEVSVLFSCSWVVVFFFFSNKVTCHVVQMSSLSLAV